MKRFSTALAALVSALAAPTWADQVFNDDLIISGALLCVGQDCADGEPLISGRDGIKLSGEGLGILFNDTSTAQGQSSRDWQIDINSVTPGDGSGFFAVRDLGTGNTPFKIEKFAASNSLYVGALGVGIGTTFPDSPFHVVGQGSTAIRLEAIGANPTNNPFWLIGVNGSGLNLRSNPADNPAPKSMMRIPNTAPEFLLNFNEQGWLGLGEPQPEGKLHSTGTGVQLVYFESEDNGPVQVRFRTNSENRRFLAVNNENKVQSQLIFKDDEILLTGPTDFGADIWLAVGPGGVVSPPPTCDDDEPCDRVFDPSVFTVPPIADRAAYMWDNMHLPAIGPTSPDIPINLTEKMGGVIHELEVAHIYIEELHGRLAAQEALNAELLARLSDVEALLDAE